MCRASPLGAAPVFSFFASSAPPPWRSAFSRFAPVVNLGLPVLASGSNRAVKPTRLRRAAYFRSLGRDAQRPSPSFFQSGAEKIKMFKFKVKYTDKDGNPVEIEISVGMSSLSNAAAAAKIGISASKIISIKKL